MKLHKADNKTNFNAIRIPGNSGRRLNDAATRLSKTYGINLSIVEFGNRQFKYLMTTSNSPLEIELLEKLRRINPSVIAVNLSKLAKSGIIRPKRSKRSPLNSDFLLLQSMLSKKRQPIDYTVQ